MGKVDKFELGKGVHAFELGMDLQKYLEDTIFPKVRIPEGGAEVHQWIYEKAKRKFAQTKAPRNSAGRTHVRAVPSGGPYTISLRRF